MQYLLLVIALAVAVALSLRYVPMREDGSGTPDVLSEKLEGVAPEQLTDRVKPGSGGGGGKRSVYRWRAEDGSWHYGDRPPPGVDEYERVEADPVITKPAEQFQGGAEESGEGESP